MRSAEDVEEEELDGGIRRQWLSQFEFSRILTGIHTHTPHMQLCIVHGFVLYASITPHWKVLWSALSDGILFCRG